MASKKDKAPLQPSESNNVNEPKIKRSAKNNPAIPAQPEEVTPSQPAAEKTARKTAAKKITPDAATAATEDKTAADASPAPEAITTAKPKKARTAKAKTPVTEVPFEPAEVKTEPPAEISETAVEMPVLKTEEAIQPVAESAALTETGTLTGATAIEDKNDMPADDTAIEALSALAEVSAEAAEVEPVAPVEETHSFIAEEKNHNTAHKLTAAHSHTKEGVHTITFFIRFQSAPGQNLFITAQHPLFGNGNPGEALPMQYLNTETWTASLQVDDQFTKMPVVYNYLLKEPDGSYIYDAGNDKKINITTYTTGEVSIVDSWNTGGFFENAFYTEPFKEVLFKNNDTQTEFATPVAFTHTFKIKAPLLTQGQVPFIAGGVEALGNWNTGKPLLLHKTIDEDFWSIAADLTEAFFAVEYKYGVYDIRENKIVQFENGANRSIYDTIETGKQTIVNDGFIHLPDNTWKGAGIAIPVFSLRTQNSFGAGEFTDIKTLADWATKVDIKLIQLLPVNDTTATKTWQDSYPYASISAFALHALYLNLEEIVSEENKAILQEFEEEGKQLNALPAVDYEKVTDTKWKVIHRVYPLQKEAVFASAGYQEFFEKNKTWLVPYAAFCYLRDKYNTAEYSRWPENKVYDEAAVGALAQVPEAANSTGMYYFVQYHLHLQLKDAAEYAHSLGIIVKGDIAIGVSRYGADTWQEPELFNMHMQAGAPPDDFAVKGQNWGFPTYNWQKMQEDGFAWWKRRFEQMSYYFDAFRIDHILGFFRIWSIPVNAIQGIFGRFVPALPVHVSEFNQRGIYFDYNRYVKPFINDQVLNDLFGDQQWWVKDHLLSRNENGTYALKEEVSTQTRLQTYFAIREDNEHNQWLKNTLFDVIANVILFEQEGSNGQEFHFRFGMENTLSYKLLDAHTQWQLRQFSIEYFYQRQDNFWYHEAMKKLPALKRATNMLICGEDLGMVPATVPKVMSELGLLSLEVQRMPKDQRHQFAPTAKAPYLSVVTPSTHDMSTIRGWWQEDRGVTQTFYNGELRQQGAAPQYCEPWINKMIIDQHLYSPAMWSIFQLQDLLGSNGSLRRSNPGEERINEPAIPRFYWRYRMHLALEDLINADEFNNALKESITNSGR